LSKAPLQVKTAAHKFDYVLRILCFSDFFWRSKVLAFRYSWKL